MPLQSTIGRQLQFLKIALMKSVVIAYMFLNSVCDIVIDNKIQ